MKMASTGATFRSTPGPKDLLKLFCLQYLSGTILVGPKNWPGRDGTLYFMITGFLQGGAVNPTPNPNLEDQASAFVTPGDRVTQL
jgi:hypothetical protein